MKTPQTYINKYIIYLIIPFIIITAVFSYFRFIINDDYTVKYEGACDPTKEKCFIGCEDGDCTTKEYYYSEVTKYAPDIYKECGNNITDCKAASVCLPGDRNCSVTYCDTKVKDNSCKAPTETTDYSQNSVNN